MTSPAAANPHMVAVVHGRNDSIRRSLFGFLRAIGLEPIEWSHAVQLTGSAAPTIKDAVQAAFEAAQAVVVLLTPDDIVKLKDEFLGSSAEDEVFEQHLMGQARPNVIFEAGLAFGLHPERTLLVEVGRTKPFSDVAGIHRLKLSNDAESRLAVYRRLEGAGCAVSQQNTEWLSVGDFDIPIGTPKYRLKPTGRLVQGPPRDGKGNEQDSAANRVRYRAVAYLATFVMEHIEALNPFRKYSLRRDEWSLHTTTDQMELIVCTLSGRELRGRVQVRADWEKGRTNGYSLELAKDLIVRVATEAT